MPALLDVAGFRVARRPRNLYNNGHAIGDVARRRTRNALKHGLCTKAAKADRRALNRLVAGACPWAGLRPDPRAERLLGEME